jgi:hypothetical protein
MSKHIATLKITKVFNCDNNVTIPVYLLIITLSDADITKHK